MCGSFVSRKSALSQGTTRQDQSRSENKHPPSSDVKSFDRRVRARFAQGSVEQRIQSTNTSRPSTRHALRLHTFGTSGVTRTCVIPKLNEIRVSSLRQPLPLFDQHHLLLHTASPRSNQTHFRFLNGAHT